jgi:hypothetical protein
MLSRKTQCLLLCYMEVSLCRSKTSGLAYIRHYSTTAFLNTTSLLLQLV